MRTLLVDADIVAFKHASAAQENYTWQNGAESVALDDLKDVTDAMDEYLKTIARQLKATDIIICLSCPSAEGWRREIYPPYKMHREGTERPKLLEAAKTHLEENYRSYRRPKQEADDVMGILSTHPKMLGVGEKIIVSEDKDMQTIPGWLFNPAKDDEPRYISEQEADAYHMLQAITGDVTDGYPGCPGIGKVKAQAILKDWMGREAYPYTFTKGARKGQTETRYRDIQMASQWDAIVSHFVTRGLTEQDALVQAQVARILRATDYCFAKKEIKLWQPRK